MSSTVTTSIRFPNPLQKASTHCGIRPFLVAVTFVGQLPPGVSEHEIPLQVSVSLSEEYGNFAVPVLQVSSTNNDALHAGTEDAGPVRLGPSSRGTNVSSHDQFPLLPFLPLSHGFDLFDNQSWVTLSLNVENWLVDIVADTESPEWVWGREIFWLSFVAANPSFPLGDWPKWNPIIPLEGPFIKSWMERAYSAAGQDGDISVNERRVLSFIWSEFVRIVSSFSPHPIFD